MLLRATIYILLSSATLPVAAHNGPPFPMISDRQMGPYTVSLWTHPDIGTGTFFVVASRAGGGDLPKDIQFEIEVRPVSGRFPERHFRTTPQQEAGQTQYYAWVPFDRQELCRIRLHLRSHEWSGETSGDVEITPTGFGSWDLLFYALPFLGIAFLWVSAMRRRRQRAR